MAGIEKICEYSGDYEGWEMYKWKYDHIQVLGKYRHHFKNKDAILLFMEPHTVSYTDSGPSPFWFIHLGKLFKYSSIAVPKIHTKFYWQWRKYSMYYEKPSLEWWYCLYVPSVQGQVEGKYWNTTRNPEKVLSNMEKLVNLCIVDNMNFTNPREEWEKNIINSYFAKFDKMAEKIGRKI